MLCLLLYEKYTPYTLNGIIGNSEAVNQVRKFSEDAQKGKSKPILIYGPSGVGKTAAARAVAYTNGFGLIELNASDYRDAETLRKKLLPAVTSRGLFNKTSLILFDEIDELSGKFDKGAENIILQILAKARQPIVFTATDYWDMRISFLRNKVEKAYFKPLATREIMDYIKKIAAKEGKEIEDKTLLEIAQRSNGDLRGALNDLEFAFDSAQGIMDCIGTRNRKLEVFNVLDRILSTNSFDAAKKAFGESDIDFEMLMNWIDENIPNRYAPKRELRNAYDTLALGSRFYEKAGRMNYWSLLRYASVMLSAGVSVAGEGHSRYVAPYSFPARIKYMSTTKKSREKTGSIAKALSEHMHYSRKYIITEFMPVLKLIVGKEVEKQGKDAVISQLENGLGLEKEEANMLLPQG